MQAAEIFQSSHSTTSPKQRRRSINLAQAQIFNTSDDEKLTPKAPANPRLHSKQGTSSLGQGPSIYIRLQEDYMSVLQSRRSKEYFIKMPDKVNNRFLSQTYMDEKLSNLYDMTTQITFPPQFFLYSPQGKGKKEKVLQKLSSCLNSRQIISNTKSNRNKNNVSTSQMPSIKPFGITHGNNTPFLNIGPSYKLDSRKSSSKSIEQEARQALNTRSQPTLMGYLPDLQNTNHSQSRYPSSPSAKEGLSVTVTTASIYSKPPQDTQPRKFLLNNVYRIEY